MSSRPLSDLPMIALRIVAIVALVLAAAIGWYYSDQILGPDAPPAIDEVAVVAATDTSVTVTADPKGEVFERGIATLEWPGGWGEMTDEFARASDRVTRRFRVQAGKVPVGGRAGERPFPFAADPRTLLGLPFDSVSIATPVGACPGWLVHAPGAGDSAWTIFVHGRGSVRGQSLRATPAFLAAGWNVLAISYRNDAGAARAAGGRYRLGATEWHDLEAAVRWALDHGAKRIVLTGYSMGGTIVLEFLRHSELSGRIEGAVLESPVVRWPAVFVVAARERRVPSPLATLGMAVTWMRTGIDWTDLDQVAHAQDVRVPVLIFQGSVDRTTPPRLADSLAARMGDRATLVRVIDAGHVRCWNDDPRGFDAALTSWLGRLGRGASPAATSARP